MTRPTSGFIYPRPGGYVTGGGVPSAPAIDPALGSYSQSSLWSGCIAANATNMTGASPTTNATATTSLNPAWVQVDYGEDKAIDNIHARCPNNELTGGFGTENYFSNCFIDMQVDGGSTWEPICIISTIGRTIDYSFFGGDSFVLPAVRADPAVFTSVALPVRKIGRYLRIRSKGTNYVAVTGFYASTNT